MTPDELLLDVEERMEKAVAVLKDHLLGIRTGRANPGLVESVRVEAYGTQVPLKQLATISCPEPNQIIIRPFDPGTLKEIERAIQASDLGFTPQNDGRIVRITVPPLSTEVRRKMVQRIKELAEEAKVAIRNVRRDGNKGADQLEKSKEISEEERDQLKKEIQDLTKKYEAQVNDLAKKRETEVLED